MAKGATVAEVAAWMRDQVADKGRLDQHFATIYIRSHFGGIFLYRNENHNLAIKKEVLAEFRRQTGDGVVWSSSEKRWRTRRKGDKPGRKQT